MIAKLVSQKYQNDKVELAFEINSAGNDVILEGKELWGDLQLARGAEGSIIATLSICEKVVTENSVGPAPDNDAPESSDLKEVVEP